MISNRIIKNQAKIFACKNLYLGIEQDLFSHVIKLWGFSICLTLRSPL